MASVSVYKIRYHPWSLKKANLALTDSPNVAIGSDIDSTTGGEGCACTATGSDQFVWCHGGTASVFNATFKQLYIMTGFKITIVTGSQNTHIPVDVEISANSVDFTRLTSGQVNATIFTVI